MSLFGKKGLNIGLILRTAEKDFICPEDDMNDNYKQSGALKS